MDQVERSHKNVGSCILSISINGIETIMNTIPSMGVLVGDHKIAVLKYADDLVLCSVTSDSLQAGVNALHDFFMINPIQPGMIWTVNYLGGVYVTPPPSPLCVSQ